MPSRFPGGSRSYAQTGSTIQGGSPLSRAGNSAMPNTARWRHQLEKGALYPGAGVLINQQIYAAIELLGFERAFSAGADSPPTPIANTTNFQSTRVFNGSRVENYSAKINLRNETPDTPVYLDVYMSAISFYEGLVWTTVWNSACPVTFVNTLGGTNGGEVALKTPIIGLVDLQTINDSAFIQRFIRPIGTITVPPAGAGGTAAINVNHVPAKCRRSNTGMHWAIYFANDALKNQGDKAVRITADISFDEIPGAAREVNYPG